MLRHGIILSSCSGRGGSGAATLELTVSGRDLAGRVAGWRERELARVSSQLSPAGRAQVTSGLHQLVMAAGEGYGTITLGLVPV